MASMPRLQRENRMKGFTLIELLVFIANAIIAYFVGRYLSEKWGTIGWFIGVPAGFFCLIGAAKVVLFISSRAMPIRPMCRNGKCGANDYKFLKITKDGSVFQCRCGDKYFRLRAAARFLEVLPDGSLRPYMKRKPFGKWQPDQDQPPHLPVSLANH